MAIPDEDVARVKDATDLVALVGEHVALRRSGRRFVGLCPFHAEKTPSFSVNPDLGFYYCFGCQASGDAITFVREVEGLDFTEAVEHLAGRAGVTIRTEGGAGSADRRRRDRLVDAVAAAVRAYHDLLMSSDEAGGARRYLRSRGFDGDAAREFELGWAPDGWDWLSLRLQQQGIGRDDLVGAGLAFVNRANRLQDQLRGRLLFPIHDRDGRPVGFGGRILEGDGPKYKNTADTPIYHKSRLLYGLHRAKAEIVSRDEAVVCEGYTDVMALHLAGVTNAVATCGTAFADDHLRILEKLTPNIVLAYDADAAGQAAAERCYHWEREHEVRFRVANLPVGSDPADLWRDDPGALDRVVRDAMPLLEFRIERRLRAADTSSIEARAHSADAVAVLVAQHPDDLVRDQYAVRLSERLDIDVDRLRSAIDRHRSGGRRLAPPRPDPVPPPAPSPVEKVELEALRWAVHEPELVADLLAEPLFKSSQGAAAFRALANAATFDEAVAAADDATRRLLLRLAVEEPERPADDEDEGQEARSDGSGTPIAVLRAELESHAPDRTDVAHSPRRIAREVVAHLVEDRARGNLDRLTAEDPEGAGALKHALDDLDAARGREDETERERLVKQLLSWVTAG